MTRARSPSRLNHVAFSQKVCLCCPLSTHAVVFEKPHRFPLPSAKVTTGGGMLA
ncbi:hypothetical protein M407DRAFT_245130 [Tulasnella calospora MUT 4182]|uniref:Uncharacterized protein n=1 Tax=Tulasnella calospora MUT 4182 TaxID=1051891 RepID=A0A0C3LMB1_9AGAM|nr:hypothetical protein M407DRAFT_245130 [Tulasnella calospora MUT 4182]